MAIYCVSRSYFGRYYSSYAVVTFVKYECDSNDSTDFLNRNAPYGEI